MRSVLTRLGRAERLGTVLVPQVRLTMILAATLVVVATAGLTCGQQLDESCTVTVGGKTAQVNPDGTFSIANVAAPDLSPVDFLSDEPVRLVGTCLREGETTYVVSDCFVFSNNQSFSFADADLTFLTEPPLLIVSISASFATPTLTAIGQSVPIDVLAFESDGNASVPDPVLDCMTFRSSNKAIVSVDADGLVTAKGNGTALVTVTANGAAAVAKITVSTGDPLTTVVGIVQDDTGEPVAGALVTLVGQAGSDLTDSNGSFSIPGVATQAGDITATMSVLIDGVQHVGASAPTAPIPGAFTDVGLVVVSNRINWVSTTSGSWHTASNWQGGFIPGNGTTAVIDVPKAAITVTYSTGTTNLAALECSETLALTGGTLSIDETSFADKLTLTGGTLTGAGDLSIDTSLSWSSTFMSGTGTTTLEPGATWTTPGPFNANLSRALINHGNSTLSVVALSLNNGTLTNSSDGTVTVSGQGISNSGGTNSVVNQGTINLTGTGTKTIGVPLTNTGTVNLQQGTLTLGGVGTSSGLLTVASGATLNVANSFTFDATSEIASSGTVQFSVGTTNVLGTYSSPVTTVSGATITFATGEVQDTFPTLTLSSGTVTFSTGQTITFPTLTLTGGTLNGSDNFNVTGSLSWSSTVMSGTGTTTIEPGVTWSAPGPFNANLSRPLINHGSGTLSLTMSLNNGTLTNAADGTITIPGPGISGTNSVINQGTINLTGAGTKTISVPLTNTGTVDLQQGTLSLSATGTSSGLLTVAPGATLSLPTSFTFDAASEIASSGTVACSGFGTINIQGDYTSPVTTLSNATVTFSTAQTVTFPTLTLTGGTLTGSDNFNVTGSLSWSSTVMSGTGTTTIEPGATWSLPGPFNVTLSRPLVNHGVGTMPFSMNLTNGMLTNAADGTVTLSSSASFFNSGGTNSLINDGFMDLTSAGTSTFTVSVTNNGTIQIGSGRTMLVSNPGIVLLNQAAGVIQGTGTLNVSGATLTQSGSVKPGTSAGILTITGNLPNTSSAVTNIELGGLVQGTEYDKLTVSGSATLDGTLNISLINGFQPRLGNTFTIMTYASKTGAFDTITGLNLGGGLVFSPTFGSTSVTLTVVSR